MKSVTCETYAKRILSKHLEHMAKQITGAKEGGDTEFYPPVPSGRAAFQKRMLGFQEIPSLQRAQALDEKHPFRGESMWRRNRDPWMFRWTSWRDSSWTRWIRWTSPAWRCLSVFLKSTRERVPARRGEGTRPIRGGRDNRERAGCPFAAAVWQESPFLGRAQGFGSQPNGQAPPWSPGL